MKHFLLILNKKFKDLLHPYTPKQYLYILRWIFKMIG